MNKIYATIGITVFLFAALCGVTWWLNSKLENSYDAGKQAGIADERSEWQKREIETKNEILRLQAEMAEQKQAAEESIKAERKVWENRIDAIKKIPTGCMPPDILRELRASGVYTGRIPCQQLQSTDH